MKLFSNPQSGDFIEKQYDSATDTFADIVNKYIPEAIPQAKTVSKLFQYETTVELCEKIFDFCKSHINYKFDKQGIEQIRLPNRVWKDRRGGVDCEDYTILISAILHNLGVSHQIKMVDFGEGWQHIYVVVDSVIIDPVQDVFNYEDSYKKSKIHYFNLAQLGRVNVHEDLTFSPNELGFIEEVKTQLESGVKQNKRSVDAIAKRFDIQDNTIIKELVELALVKVARIIANFDNRNNKVTFDKIVELYNNQMILSYRTSISILLQQYSTALPIAFLAGLYLKDGNTSFKGLVLEPTAGNGMLTIAFRPYQCYVNELDDLRYRNLTNQGFKQYSRQNALDTIFESMSFEGVITNPPFGRLLDKENYNADGFVLKDLDHVLCYKALLKMKDDGRAALIIGGHTNYDEQGRLQAGKNRIFLSYLYKNYHVEDVININGDLYARQGTSFDIRLILINGRRANKNGIAPLKPTARANVINTFEELYTRVVSNFSKGKNLLKYKYRLLLIQQEQERLYHEKTIKIG